MFLAIFKVNWRTDTKINLICKRYFFTNYSAVGVLEKKVFDSFKKCPSSLAGSLAGWLASSKNHD